MSKDYTEEELAKLISDVIEEMQKHFSQENDNRFNLWDIPAPHLRLGRPQEVHGDRPGKRRMVLALRAAAKAHGLDTRAVPKWNDLIRMDRDQVYEIGQRTFGGRFDDVLNAMPRGGAGTNLRMDDMA